MRSKIKRNIKKIPKNEKLMQKKPEKEKIL